MKDTCVRATSRLRFAVSASVLAMVAAPGFAQTTDTSSAGQSQPSDAAAKVAAGQPDATAPAQPSSGLEDIVVTARRIEENLQDVPLSVTALGTAQLTNQQVQQVADLRSVVPNLVTQRTSTAGSTNVLIRGQSSGTLPNIALDNRLGIYLDGVYIGRTQGGSFQLADIARLEVLRGPQGTQFGKNLTAGAINFITANPSGEASGLAEATVGNFGRRRYRLTLESPEFGGFSIRASAVHDELDGDIKNATPGLSFGRVVNAATGLDFRLKPTPKNFGGYNTEAYFLALRYAGDALTVDLKGDYTDTYERTIGNQTLGYASSFVACGAANLALGLASSCPGAAWPLPLTSAAANNVPISFDKLRTIAQDTSAPAHIRSRGVSLTLNYDLNDDFTLRSITGYRRLNTRGQLNLAGGNVSVINNNLNLLTGGAAALPPGGLTPYCISCSYQFQRQKQFSEEVQFLAKLGDSLDALVGLYYFKEKGYSNNIYVANYNPINATFGFGLPAFQPSGTTPVPAFAYSNGDDTNINSRSQAVFGRLTWRPAEQFDIVVGARYTGDRKRSVISTTLASQVDANPLTPTVVESPRLPGGSLPLADFLDRTVKFTKFTYDGTATYHVNNDVNVYARYATAYLAGGLLRNFEFTPETTRSVELGFKSDLFDRRLRVNAAAFYQKSKNIQVATNAPPFGALILDNVGSLKTKGFEVEVTAAPVTGLILNASGGYNKQNYSNDQRQNAPSWTAQFGGSLDLYETSGGVRFILQADTNYRSKFFGNRFSLLDPVNGGYDPSIVLPAQLYAGRFATQADYIAALDEATTLGDYWLTNARLSIADIPFGGTKGTISVWGRNLFNVQHVQYATNFGTSVAGFFEQNRTYGVDLRLAF